MAQTDNAKDRDLYLCLAGVKSLNKGNDDTIITVSYDYPYTQISIQNTEAAQFEFKLGSAWSWLV